MLRREAERLADGSYRPDLHQLSSGCYYVGAPDAGHAYFTPDQLANLKAQIADELGTDTVNLMALGLER